MKYQDIRKFSYKTEKKVLKSEQHNFDMNNWLHSPYTCLKVRLYIELASLIVYLIQNTNIKPNHISYLYAIAGIVGGIFLSINNYYFIIVGILIIFFKVVIDGSDGLLARVKYKPSNFGAALDSWGGLVGEYSFIIGFGLYLFNMTQNLNFIYLTLLIVFLKTLNLKNYILLYIGSKKQQSSAYISKKFLRKKRQTSNNIIDFVKNLIKNGYNYQAKTVDLILLIMLIELNQGKVIFSNYFFYIFVLRGLIIFLGAILLIKKDDFFTDSANKNTRYKKK